MRKLDISKLKVTGIADGSIVFGNEPLISIHGPIGLVQLIETPILNCVNFATLMTTNAARMVLKAGPKVACVEFGLRRA